MSSSVDKPRVFEVVLDHNGVARRVPEGQGTHLIHVSQDKETRMEQKFDEPILPSKLRSPESALYKPPPKPKSGWNMFSTRQTSAVAPSTEKPSA
ncbi:hypothetical protein VTP01DRAFT_9566 [Rhizomucor pusillus]|uniref:uncharacterized protein n=1 Tax=Rhizomucor pusillus TaxID=4840 RepID=UPI0037441EDE